MMKENNKLKILFILSRILGGKTFSNGIVSAVEEISFIDPVFLFFDGEDYPKQMPSRMRKMIGRFPASQSARKKFDDNIKGEFDVIFIQSFELMLEFKDIIRRKPSILAHDGTNVLGHWFAYKQAPSLSGYLKFCMKSILTTAFYKRAVRNIDIFLPRTRWAAASLIRHYNVPYEKIIVTPGSVDLDLWNAKPRKTKSKPHALFVGNDFERKGGPFLLQLMSEYLDQLVTLTIVSNDKSLSKPYLPVGVSLHQGITHDNMANLIRIYRNSDCFIFPTHEDRLGLVLLEAASMALPIIATDVGGISDVVIHGWNGYLMSPSASLDEWAGVVIHLINNPDQMREFGSNSRKLAERKFSSQALKANLFKAISQLRL